MPAGRFLVRSLFLALRGLPSLCAHMISPCVYVGAKTRHSRVSSSDTNAPLLLPHLTLITFLESSYNYTVG